jgi:hypothetical protein
MNGTHDTDETPTPDTGGGLGLREAAALLEQTRRQARRQLEVHKPLFVLLQAAAVLGIYGAIWLSVRGQHPYQGPSLRVIGPVYTVLVVAIVATTVTMRRATTGVSGRSRQEQRIVAAPIAVAWVAVYLFMGALHYDGFSNAIVYGVFDAAAPWVVVGAAVAGGAAVREDWVGFGTAVAIIPVGAASVFAGPIGVWAILALAGGTGLVAKAVVQSVLLRRA